MRTRQLAVGMVVALWSTGCAGQSPAPDAPAMGWVPSRIVSSAPSSSLAAVSLPERPQPVPDKFSLRFYQKLRAHPVVAPLASVDVWELRHHPRQYDIITIGSVPVSQYSRGKDLLDQLAVTNKLTKDKADVLMSWVTSGGVVWVEFGVFIQGHEWTRRAPQKAVPTPDLTGFTVFGLPTRVVSFEAKRIGAFAIESVVFTIRNEAQHAATADIKTLTLVQSDLKTYFPIVDPSTQGEALVRSTDRVYATVTPLGRGKIISTVPFDASDAAADGEKYRINLFEWLAGYPVPVFDPVLDVERQKD